MKKQFSSVYNFIKQALFDDVVDRYLFLVAFFVLVAVCLVWHFKLSPDVYVYAKTGLYPIKFSIVVFIFNTFLAISSHNKEKEISNLLLMANLIVVSLILILELFYLLNV